MTYKKVLRALIFPHIAVMIALLPISVAFLVYSMVFLGTESIEAIASYVVAAYTLAVWCVRIPNMIRFFKTFKNENKYVRRWQNDDRLRVKTSLYGTFIWNAAYAIFQLWLGFYHHTFWFYSLAGYYASLAVMRFFLVRYTSSKKGGRGMHGELIRYRACGWIFLFMNLALALIVFFMVYWNRTFNHHEITTIAMAAYTFGSFALAVVNIVKYRKFNSPIYSASKAISLAAASVSILTLESTMLTTFGDGTMDAFTRKMMLGASGGAIIVFIVIMAIYMIVNSTKKLKLLKQEKN